MAGPVATCAGSSGGAQPPPDPRRLSGNCESAPEVLNRTQEKTKKKGRGVAKEDIISTIANGGKIKVNFDMDGKTYKAIGPNANWWQSAVGIHTRDCCDPFYDQWVDVPGQQKAMIRQRMLDLFDVNLDGILREVLDRDANECYNDWKSNLSKHFKRHGGMPAALNRKPQSVRNNEQWRRCCQRFSSLKFQTASRRNSENRQTTEDTSSHGRKAYVQYLNDKADPKTGELYSPIENWKDQRTRGGQWTNEESQKKYDDMDEDRQTQLASGSANERAIMENHLGKRRKRMSGVGPTLRKSAFRYAESIESASETSSLSKAYATIRRMDTEMTQLKDALARFIPGFHVAPPDDLPSSSNDDHDSNEDAANLED